MSNSHQEAGVEVPPAEANITSPVDHSGAYSDPEGQAAAYGPRSPRTRSFRENPQWRPPVRKSMSRAMDYSSDHDVPVQSPSVRSNRPLRYQNEDDMDDDYYYRDDFQRDSRHPDIYTRRASTRPPRAYLNRQYNIDDGTPSPGSTGKTYVEENISSRPSFRRQRIRDEEMGMGRNNSGGGDDYDSSAPRIEWKNLSKEEKAEVLRLPFTAWMNSDIKNHFVACLGEFVGTTLFLLFAFAGTEVANIQSQASDEGNDSNTTTGGATGFDVSVLLYIALIFGFSLMVNVWIFFRISGGLFNPAVTFAMVLVKAISATRAVCLFVAQILGSMLASVIVRYLFPESFNVRTTLSGGTTIVQGVFIEAVLTAELVFTIFMLAKEKHRATFIAPVGIGLALFIAEMVGVQFTGGSLNPARSFGPCVITLTFDPEHWIYWVGPFAGALIAVVFYRFIKTLEYEMANPGADGDPLNDPTVNPEKLLAVKNRTNSAQ